MNKIVKRMTLSAVIGALYFSLCLAEGPLASGFMANVRLAEGFLVLAIFCPEVVLGCSIGCFFYNFFFGFGIYDALIGTTATIFGGLFVVLVGKLFKKDYFRLPLFGLALVLLNAILVPIVLIISLEDLDWTMYWIEFGIVAAGEALAVYGVGIPLYYALKKFMVKFFVDSKIEKEDKEIEIKENN